MKKLTTVLLTSAYVLTITNNSFSMLTKASSIKQIKKIKSFHTSKQPMNIFDILAWCDASDASKKASDNQELLKENNNLLHKIIEQNKDNNNLLKENNELLRAALKQNALHFSIQHNYLFKMPTADHYTKLSLVYEDLKKKYNLKINPNE